MRRRQTLVLLAAAATNPPVARAQQNKKIPIIGFIHPGRRALGAVTMDVLRRDMGQQGYVEGQTVHLEERWGEGKPERLTQMARELVALRADLIIAVARPSIEAALAATKTIPIVANDLENDPVAMGYIASLARPGGNLTGQFLDAPTICGKWLQLIGELVPNLRKVAVLWDSLTGPHQRDAFAAAAKASSIDSAVIEYGGVDPTDAAIAASLTPDAQALVQLGSPIINQTSAQIAAVLASRRLPSISPFRIFPEKGGLVSYGPDLPDMYRRLVPYVVKVLRGANPGDLPIEQPTKFELVLNLKTARAFGLTVPPKFLLSADEVIE
jgi:putative ABC transport system substrate-binding protein